jgi:hypothetical protein
MDAIRKVLRYDPDTGFFFRIDSGFDKITGSLHKISGYVQICVLGQQFTGHRLAWYFVHGEFPNQIDHINGIRHDNRIVNLRPSDQQQNMANLRLWRQTITGAKGVWKRRSKYGAYIIVDQKKISLGSHETLDEAAHAYNKAAIKYFGEFACLNPIGQDK